MDRTSLRSFVDELQKIAEATVFQSKEHVEKTLQPGDILVTQRRDNAPLSRMLGVFQGTKFPHAAMYVGKNQVVDASAGAGVRKTRLQDFIDTYRFKAYRVSDIAKEDGHRAAKFVRDQVGKGYNYGRTLRLVAPVKEVGAVKGDTPDSFTCSQLIAHAYDTPLMKSRGPDNVRPVDFQRSRKLELVGKMTDGTTR